MSELEKKECTCGCGEHDCDCGCEDFEYKGKAYSAFEPAEQIDGIEDDDLVIFELSGDDDETAELLPVEDEALLDEVFEEFCRVLEEDELAEEAENLEK